MFKNIKMSELEKLMQSHKIHIIDCREDDEYEEGHIPGAILMPTSNFVAHMNLINKDTEYYVVCLTGARSQMVARYLDHQGYKVTNVLGGMITYQGEIEI